MFENIFRRIRLARTSVVQFNNGQYGVRRRGLFGNTYLDLDYRPQAGREFRFWRGNDNIRKWCMSYSIEAPIDYRNLYVEHGAYMPEDSNKPKKLKCEVIPDDQLDVERALNKIRQSGAIKGSEFEFFNKGSEARDLGPAPDPTAYYRSVRAAKSSTCTPNTVAKV